MLSDQKITISCIVPARNESGHLLELINEILGIEQISNIVIVEGGSSDNTWEVIKEIQRTHPILITAIQQNGTGKFNAVLCGAAIVSTDYVLIWDADRSISPKDTLSVINLAIQTQNPVIGNRLKGTIAPGAMRFANYVGNWLFAIAWAPLLKFKITDMLCGTKIFPTTILTDLPTSLINADPYGDFALVAYSRIMGMDVLSIPVDYKARVYGYTNIRRWSGGMALLLCTLRVYFLILRSLLTSKVVKLQKS
jgi:glycosyltransferase involved in cell wall biosynthesis